MEHTTALPDDLYSTVWLKDLFMWDCNSNKQREYISNAIQI